MWELVASGLGADEGNVFHVNCRTSVFALRHATTRLNPALDSKCNVLIVPDMATTTSAMLNRRSRSNPC